MEQRFTTLLSIIKVKLGDTLQFSVDSLTPFTPFLTVYDIDDTVLYGPVLFESSFVNRLYWNLDVAASNGFSAAKTYYKVKVDDSVVAGYPDRRWVVYVTDDLSFEGYIDRCLGLSGSNMRKFSYVWTRGQLTSFDIKLYSTAAKLDLADAGTSDDFIAHYRVTISYDVNYNPYLVQSVRIS